MKVQFLGTAAAEGFPAVFCNCAYCQSARKLGGKNIRTRSQTLINDELLIDLPADTYHHFLQNNIEGDKIKYLLITHSHSDHFYPAELHVRGEVYAKNKRVDYLQVYCGSGAYEKIQSSNPHRFKNVTTHLLEPFQTVTIGDYEVTPLPARHAAGDGALIYIIRGDKTLLYAHDTGYFYDEVFKFIQEKGIVFDMVSLDCTNIDIPITDEGSHMGFPNIGRVLNRLADIGAINSKTIRYVNHFSHNANPQHHILQQRAAEYRCQVSYDGCSVCI